MGTPISPAIRTQAIGLDDAPKLLLEECRMILPGIQALFGFQMIAVFSPGFSHSLGKTDQYIHFGAIGLICVAIGLIMTPAAYHRQEDPCEVSLDFIRVCTRLMLLSMAPLALGLGLDVYVVARVIFNSWFGSCVSGLIAFYFFFMWFVFPKVAKRKYRNDRG